MARLVPPFLPPDIGWIDSHKGLEMCGRPLSSHIASHLHRSPRRSVWRMPDDLPERGRQYDAQQLGGGVAVELTAPAHREHEISARRHGSFRPGNPDGIHPLPAARLQGLRSAAEMRQQALHRRRQRVPLLEAQTKPSACPVIADRKSFERISASKASGDRQWDDRYPHSLRHHLARSLEALHTDTEV